MYGPVRNINTYEWRIRSNKKLDSIFHKSNVLETIKKKDCNRQDMQGAARTPYYLQYWKRI